VTTERQRTLILVLLLVGVLFVVFFGLRFLHALREFRGHRPPHFPPPGATAAEIDVELIRDWMTIPYISITYGLPPDLLYKTLNIPPKENEQKSLKQLNDEYFPGSPGIVLEKVKTATSANQPRPTQPAPETALPPLTPVTATP
jgi:hypothetical protein